MIGTRSRKMAATQAQLNARTGGGAGVAPTTAPAAAPLSGGRSTGYSKNILSTLLVIAGVIVFFVGAYNTTALSNPSPASVGNWSQNRWLALLILWGIVAALIALNACGPTAKTLQKVLAGIVAALLIVFPLWGKATSQSAAVAQKRVQPAEASTLRIPAGVGEKSKRIPVPFRKRVVMTGEDFRHHCIYGDGHEESFIPRKEPPCRDGDLPFVYATNLKKDEENVVAYAYAD